MQVIIAFVILEIHGEFGVTGNVSDFIPDTTTRPLSDVPEFRGCEPESIKVV